MTFKITGQITVIGAPTASLNNAPTWTTASGTIGTQDELTAINFQFEATDAQQGTSNLTYTVASGSLPAGATLNSSTGLLTGTASDVESITVSNFTLRVTDTPGLSSDRAFSMTISNVVPVGPILLSWGASGSGQLGHGNITPYSSPVQVGQTADWANVAVGFDGSHAIKTDGTLWGWGENNDGEVGDGTTIKRSSPVQIGSLTDWVSVSVSASSSPVNHAIKTDGTIWGWGAANLGQMGLGALINHSSPVQIGSDADWASVNHISSGTLAIKTNGELWVWGRGVRGALGLGDIANRSSPVQLGLLSDWATIGGGQFTTLATKTDGTLWAWGDGVNGLLGTGNVVDLSSPIQVGALTGWTSVDLRYSTVAVRSGKLYSWGGSNSGVRGDGTATGDVNSPVQVGSLANWDTVVTSSSAAFAIKTDNTLWAWGANNGGRLGLGDTISRSSPVQVGSNNNWNTVDDGTSSTLGVRTTT